jgi:putative transcription factor
MPECELCGGERATAKAMVEGAVVSVCEHCLSFGKQVYEPRPMKKRKRKTTIEDIQIDPDYAQKIRKAREEMGIKREDFAKKVNIKESVLERIEKGKMLPNVKNLVKLEKVLGIRLTAPEQTAPSLKATSSPALTLGDVVKIKLKKK